MAIISKIRNQSGLLIGAIGISMLFFIVGGDFLSGGGLFGSSGGGPTELAIVNGSKVSFDEYNYRIDAQMNTIPPDQRSDEVQKSVREYVWEEILRDHIMLPQYAALGITLSSEELQDAIVGANPHRTVRAFFQTQDGSIHPSFRDPATGDLNVQLVANHINSVIGNPQHQDYNAWIRTETLLRKQLLDEKYVNAVRQGVFATNLQAARLRSDREKKLDLRYVKSGLEEIADSTVQVTDEEMRAYYNSHQNDPAFRADKTTRSIEFVTWDLEPSEEDISYTMRDLDEIKSKFDAENPNDSAFVDFHADNDEIREVKPGQLPLEFDSLVQLAERGEFFGPFQEPVAQFDPTQKDIYKLLLVMGDTTYSDSARVRQIQISMDVSNPNDTAGLRRQYLTKKGIADSLKVLIDGGTNFESLLEFSDDPLGRDSAGMYPGWIRKDPNLAQQLTQNFIDSCLMKAEGESFVLTTNVGLSVVQVVKKTAPSTKKIVGLIDRKAEPSEKTKDIVDKQARDFLNGHDEMEDFRSSGRELGNQYRIANKVAEGTDLSDLRIQGMESGDELVRWAYGAEIGDFSEVRLLGRKYVVAVLTEIAEKGPQPFERVELAVREEVIKEKKIQMLSEKMQGQTDIAALASSLGKEVASSEGVVFANNTIDGNNLPDPKALGAVFALERGQISQPIAGNTGVYVVVVDNIIDDPTAGGDAEQLREEINQQERSRVRFAVQPALRDKAEIVDNRFK